MAHPLLQINDLNAADAINGIPTKITRNVGIAFIQSIDEIKIGLKIRGHSKRCPYKRGGRDVTWCVRCCPHVGIAFIQSIADSALV